MAEEPVYMSDRKGHNGISEDGTATTLTAQEKERPMVGKSIVRRLTPTECMRLQNFPEMRELDISKMTKDEYIAWNLAAGNLICDAENGKVYATRGPGGKPLKQIKELKGTLINGYLAVTIANGDIRRQCRMHRIIWVSVNGVVPDGYCIDHINNDKTDNRISNLQLLTPAQNSSKASEDGLYKAGLDSPTTKLDPGLHDEIRFLYYSTGVTQKQLAEDYGVSSSRIQQIVSVFNWCDLGEWTDSNGKKHKDSDTPKYKAAGNSIARPFWQWLTRRIAAQYEGKPPTLGSLFDGIGGFPLSWAEVNGPDSVIWASEIEEFPIAVAKKHFGDDDAGIVGDIQKYL